MAFCKVPKCGREATSDLCERCRSSLYYWSNRGKEQRKLRLERLEFYKERLSLFVTDKMFKPPRR